MYGENVAGYIALFAIACVIWDLKKWFLGEDIEDEHRRTRK